MPESLRTTMPAPPLVAPATIRSASPLERTYPLIAGFGPTYVMSIAPANKASMADGPALKVFQSIFVCCPMALSNQPFALPIMACGCVMLGKAPTRITAFCPKETPVACATKSPRTAKNLALMRPLASVNHHGKNACFGFLTLTLLIAAFGFFHNVGESGTFLDLCDRIPHLQKDLVQLAMRQVAIDQVPQRFGVAKRRQRPIDQPDNLAQANLGRQPAQLISALGAPHAFHHARVLQFQQNQFEKLFRQSFFVRDIANLDRALLVVPRQHHHGLQCVQTLLRDLH